MCEEAKSDFGTIRYFSFVFLSFFLTVILITGAFARENRPAGDMAAIMLAPQSRASRAHQRIRELERMLRDANENLRQSREQQIRTEAELEEVLAELRTGRSRYYLPRDDDILTRAA